MGKKTVNGIWEMGNVIGFTLHAAAQPRRYEVPIGAPLKDRDTGAEWTITLILGGNVDLDYVVDPVTYALVTTRHRAMSLASLPYAFDLEPYRKSGPPLRTNPKRWAEKHDTPAEASKPAPIARKAEQVPLMIAASPAPSPLRIDEGAAELIAAIVAREVDRRVNQRLAEAVAPLALRLERLLVAAEGAA